MAGLPLIDLFAGAGGLSLGFSWAGFKSAYAVECERAFAATFRSNFNAETIEAPLEAVWRRLPKVRDAIVIGGPPCQGFSNLTGNRHSDPRRSLTALFMDAVERTKPVAFVMENVPNMLTSNEGQLVIKRARKLGYHINADSAAVLLASRFGVPQNRRRAFLVGTRERGFSLPVAHLQNAVSVRQAWSGLFAGDSPIPIQPLSFDFESQPVSGSDLHVGRRPTATSVKRYRCVPAGGNRFDLQRRRPDLTPRCWLRKTSGGTDLFGRLLWDEPARCTIRCEFFKPEKGRYLHPSAHRPITHWEAARLQSFPDSFKWCGTKLQVATQIGNAVPPLLAYAVASALREHLGLRLPRSPAQQLLSRLGPIAA